ncbi:BC1872 family protein [Brevibacillus laterosporus]|uniref:BC1872 family protein n=1 Tax=Brevibacillus laterosporus TaxID=1465 RepID=UPI0003B18E1D|nr:hypothetical protein [Brevibacillus laterosporus]ERM19017.1 hypothetical protein P615_14095 [Brevibacillus laterosporus PE36]
MTDQQIILTLATKVMGWKRYQETDFWFGDNGNLFNSSLWNPLENIADAFQVVDRLLSHFYIFELVGVENGWVAIFKLVDVNFIYPKMFDGAGKTREKAICKAAMEVVAEHYGN